MPAEYYKLAGVERQCSKCHVIKPLYQFGPYAKGWEGKYPSCLDCMRQWHLSYRHSNPQQRQKQRDRAAARYAASKPGT